MKIWRRNTRAQQRPWGWEQPWLPRLASSFSFQGPTVLCRFSALITLTVYTGPAPVSPVPKPRQDQSWEALYLFYPETRRWPTVLPGSQVGA